MSLFLKVLPWPNHPVLMALSFCGSSVLRHRECDRLADTWTVKSFAWVNLTEPNITYAEVSHCVLLEAQQVLANQPVSITRAGKDQEVQTDTADKGELKFKVGAGKACGDYGQGHLPISLSPWLPGWVPQKRQAPLQTMGTGLWGFKDTYMGHGPCHQGRHVIVRHQITVNK